MGGKVNDAVVIVSAAATTDNAARSAIIVTSSSFAVTPGKACARLFSNVIRGLFGDEVEELAKFTA